MNEAKVDVDQVTEEIRADFEKLLARIPSEEPAAPPKLAAPEPLAASRAQSDEKELRAFRDDFARHYHEAYDMLVGLLSDPSLPNTHAMITRKAIELVGSVKAEAKAALIAKVSDPDHFKTGTRLVMEGHFYGAIGAGRCGNFLQAFLPAGFFARLDKVDDVHENTHENFSKHLASFREHPADHDALAWALHYLQDLTEPHHAANSPAILAWFMYDYDTHIAFEARAKRAISHRSADFDPLARQLYPVLDELFRSQGVDRFLQEIFDRSRGNIDERIETKVEAAWDQVMDQALPLAIAATAVVLKNSPSILG